MDQPICYLGDDAIGQAASYLAGVMAHFGLPFDHVPSTSAPPADFRDQPYGLYVVSDYPAARWQPGDLDYIAARVAAGAGLLMLGGWESFFGQNGEYHRTPLAEVLPVVMAESDDRRNSAQPCLVRQVAQHPILADLPWQRPPSIGGYNALAVKAGAQVLLSAVRFEASWHGAECRFVPGETAPLLVVGQHGQGRTAALATDAAPHWVGGLVDWGDRRVTQAIGAGAIEVGNWYAQFFRNLLVWTAGG